MLHNEYSQILGFLLFLCLTCRDVHAVCLWDDKGPAKIHQALKEDILDFIKQAQAVRTVYRICTYNKVKIIFLNFSEEINKPYSCNPSPVINAC